MNDVAYISETQTHYYPKEETQEDTGLKSQIRGKHEPVLPLDRTMGSVQGLSKSSSSELEADQQTEELSINPRRKTLRINRFEALMQWRGRVIDFDDEYFWAEIESLSETEPEEEEVQLSIQDLDEADRPLLRRYAEFYWSVGYSYTATGREKTSKIRFKRYPKRTDYEMDKAYERGQRVLDRLLGSHEQ